MKLTHFAAANWCNFAHIEFDMSSRVFIVGPNSSGKSNLLGALRFLSDIAGTGWRPPRKTWVASTATSTRVLTQHHLSRHSTMLGVRSNTSLNFSAQHRTVKA